MQLGSPKWEREGRWEMEAPSRSWYRVLQLNCPGDAWRGTMSFIAVNPGGEYLSMSDVPNKTLYLITSFLWTVIYIAWASHVWLYRAFNVRLHTVMVAAPVLKAADSVAQLMYWRLSSETGIEPQVRAHTHTLACTHVNTHTYTLS